MIEEANMKKKIIAIVLAVLLVVTTSLLLVSCSGISNEEDWNKAMDAYQTADSLTLTVTDQLWIYNSIVFQDHVKEKSTISFDAEKGVVSIICVRGGNNLSGFHSFTEHRYYYVLDGTNVVEYYRYVSEYSDEWKQRTTHEFDTVDLAKEYLRDQYLNYLDSEKLPFVPFTELNYMNFSSNTFGTFKYEKTDDGKKYAYALKFSNGKTSEYTYEYKHDKDPSRRKTEMKIKYSAKVTLPDDLPVNEDDFII